MCIRPRTIWLDVVYHDKVKSEFLTKLCYRFVIETGQLWVFREATSLFGPQGLVPAANTLSRFAHTMNPGGVYCIDNKAYS